MTVITPGGHEVAAAQIGKLLDSVHYAPFDVPWSAARAVSSFKPCALMVMETEIWPNMLYFTRRAGARILLVNGRISDRSFPRYLSARGLFRWALAQFDRILTQTPTDSDRFKAIGAEPSRVEAIGNTKFDQDVPALMENDRATLKRSLGIDETAPVFVIGSTRSPEEERILIRAYVEVRKSVPVLALIHAPRHVDRAEEVESLMRDEGLRPVRKTALQSTQEPVSQLILDTFGELSAVYGIADVAFIGNSLTAPGGGQNLLQPLAHGKPVLYGQYMQNFRDLESIASDSGVGFRVADQNEVVSTLVDLLQNPDRREKLSVQARQLVETNRGAARRYAEALLKLLQPDQ
jgi:3-deoxy-D-manno-octulosonic-acid transferase